MHRFAQQAAWVCLLVALTAGLYAADDAAAKFKEVFNKTPEEVKALVGEPDGHYFDGQQECWLYAVVTKELDGEKMCPVLMFSKGKVGQVNLITEEIMKKSIAVAKGFADFEPVAEPKPKTFELKDTAVVGKTRAEIEKVLGKPDYKKIFNGKEVWVYTKVPFGADQKQEISIYLEFEGDKCTASNGN